MTELKLQLSHYPVSLLSRCMMRHEFVRPTRGSTKGWIQSRAPGGQAGRRPSWGAPASHHLHTAFRSVSPSHPSLSPSATHPFPHLHAPANLICIPVLLPLLISAQSISSVHHTSWSLCGGQLCGLSCEHSFHFVAVLLSSWLWDLAVWSLMPNLFTVYRLGCGGQCSPIVSVSNIFLMLFVDIWNKIKYSWFF